MIKDGDILAIGSLLKPHGIKGEINLELSDEIDLEELRCIVVKIDGINVPFFINSIRPKAAFTRLVTVDGINSEQEAKNICGQTVYALKSDLPEDNDNQDGRFYVSDLIGFKILLSDGTDIGEIVDFDDSTDNVLLIVQSDADESRRIFIPIADEFIEELRLEDQQIVLNLPEGLININD